MNINLRCQHVNRRKTKISIAEQKTPPYFKAHDSHNKMNIKFTTVATKLILAQASILLEYSTSKSRLSPSC